MDINVAKVLPIRIYVRRFVRARGSVKASADEHSLEHEVPGHVEECIEDVDAPGLIEELHDLPGRRLSQVASRGSRHDQQARAAAVLVSVKGQFRSSPL